MKILTREIAATFEAIRGEKGKEHIDLITHIPENTRGSNIYSDPLRIQQILTNLLGNALKFTDADAIQFGFEWNDANVEFFVKNEGIGIPPERIKLIFERFQHFEGTAQKYEGTGLGLSISKGLAELLGATLTVESELRVGSTFRLKIPLEGPNQSNKTHHISPAGESKPINACTLLIAEDEATNQRLIQKILKPLPITTYYADNGHQAIQSYQKHPGIDVVLMDIRMPLMNGDEAAREILKLDPDARIIAQTAYAMREEHEKFLKIGFVDYICKPYKSKDLIAIIEKWV